MRNRPSVTPSFTIALCGNPNSGKTTLFNALTGNNQKVGNWPGVTVERKTGTYEKDPSTLIVDTPGIYSLTPFTTDEKVAVDYLKNQSPDLIINVLDSTNLERSLFLTTQLTELNVPVIVALNMTDEATKKGIYIDPEVLENKFGCKFIPISAGKSTGVDKLMNYAKAKKSGKPKPTAISAEQATARNKLGETESRYERIADAVKQAVKRYEVNDSQLRSQRLTAKIDEAVLNKWLAFPIFVAVMSLVFYLSVGGLGGLLTEFINNTLTPLLKNAASSLLAPTETEWLQALVVDGVIGGVMSVVGFTPQIMILFGCIAVLEASGYMSRIAFITDRLLNKIGLGGRSFVAMILGCGCSVPAITSTRAIKNENERNATITLAPFMPCSAKLALIAFFTTYLFKGGVIFAISFYFLSILSVIAGGLIIKAFKRNKTDGQDAFIMELPPYRAPTIKNVVRQMAERGKAFLIKAGTVIFVSSIILWVLQNFNFKFEAVSTEQSMLASFGKFIAPVFMPLGWGDRGYCWQFSVATITGISAKETVITTLEILLPNGVENGISALGAYSFVAYNLLTVPCIAAVGASFTEQGSAKKGLSSVLFQTIFAYVVSLVIYQTGKLAQKNGGALIAVVTAAVLTLAAGFAVAYLLKRRKSCSYCSDCKNCYKCKRQK